MIQFDFARWDTQSSFRQHRCEREAGGIRVALHVTLLSRFAAFPVDLAYVTASTNTVRSRSQIASQCNVRDRQMTHRGRPDGGGACSCVLRDLLKRHRSRLQGGRRRAAFPQRRFGVVGMASSEVPRHPHVLRCFVATDALHPQHLPSSTDRLSRDRSQALETVHGPQFEGIDDFESLSSFQEYACLVLFVHSSRFAARYLFLQ